MLHKDISNIGRSSQEALKDVIPIDWDDLPDNKKNSNHSKKQK